MDMTALDTHLSELSDDKRQQLESWLVEFDLSWDDGKLAWWLGRLPPRGDALRRAALVEMVKIDLERRWQRGQPARLEGYLKSLPELGAAEHVPADFLLAEFEARKHCGLPVDLAEFAQRFPRQADKLGRLVGRLSEEAASASNFALHDTMKPEEHGTDASACPSSPCPPAVAVSLPERLGRYRILRELGRGAMGKVYLAHDAQLDRQVALKVPTFSAGDGPEVRQRFLSEARAAASIEHPNVCPVYDVGEINGAPYLTMAYLQGQSLAQLLEGSAPWSERHAATLVRQLTVALQAAHARGIIHRDLKPSNIMINGRGEPVILDFGLARRLCHDGARLTQSGQPLGTPAYMSPEQVAGAVGVMGPGCDVYALGVVLYQLLTGRLPFEGSMSDVLVRIISQQPEPPSKARPDLDPRLEAICLKALSKEVADRYGSMQALGAALADYLRGHSPQHAVPLDRGLKVPAGSPDGGARPPTPWLSRRSLWLLLAATTGAAAAVLVVYLLFRQPPAMGTIRIELDGPRAEVELQVDGERIDNAAATEPLRLHPGKHQLLITGQKVQTVNTTFTVASGDNPVLRVLLVPGTDGPGDPVRPPPTDKKRRRHAEDDDDDPYDDD
jgi:hypothetical protein